MLSLRFEQARKTYSDLVESMYHAARIANGYGYTAVEGAPATIQSMREAWFMSATCCRSFPVWIGGSHKTVFMHPAQNYMFRYLHDHCHVEGNFGLKPEHERILGWVWTWKVLHMTRMRDVALIAELDTVGQTDYYAEHGHFPEDQLSFVRAKFMERAV